MSAVAEIAENIFSRGKYLSELLHDAPIALAVLQAPGCVTAVNPAFEQLLGLAENSQASFLVDLIPSRNREELKVPIANLFCGSRFQIEIQADDAKGRVCRWTGWPVRGSEDAADSALVMVEDLSHITIAQQRLRQAASLETVGRLAGGIAHDFNNVLTGVLLHCDLLLSVLESSHRGRTYAEEIREAGLQATGLVRQLLTVSRPTKSSPRPISLNEVVEGMRNLLTRLIGESIELRLRLDSELGLVKMDPTQAQQILLNLVLNARDALPGGGKIDVETGNCHVQALSDHRSEKGANPILPCALFSVADNGLGMDESVRSHLFEPFFTTKPGNGNGIGLATVHNIVTTNGGLIHVESKPGCGTRISVLLPLVPQSYSDSLQSKTSYPANRGDLLSFQAKDSNS